jgi:hypothetical protein
MSQRSKRLSHLYFTPESFRYTDITKSTVQERRPRSAALYMSTKICTRYMEEVQKFNSDSSGLAQEDFRSLSLSFLDVSIGLSPEIVDTP